jgi:hypothetical protein
MNRSLGLSAGLATRAMTATDAPQMRRPGGASAAGNAPAGGQQPSVNGAGTSPRSTSPRSISPVSTSPSPRDRHDRMARRMNDVVVRRIFAAGLDLQAALGLIGEDRAAADQRAASKICHATDELDHAIRDLRVILFEGGPELSPGQSTALLPSRDRLPVPPVIRRPRSRGPGCRTTLVAVA